MAIPFPVKKAAVEEMAASGKRKQHLLRTFAGIFVSTNEAETLWPQILEHKWFLSEQLGRDVGLRVAAADYLDNMMPANRKMAA